MPNSEKKSNEQRHSATAAAAAAAALAPQEQQQQLQLQLEVRLSSRKLRGRKTFFLFFSPNQRKTEVEDAGGGPGSFATGAAVACAED
jgi:hypothetical protein